MKLKISIAAMLLLCAYGRLQAQAITKPLQQGDTLPNVAIQLVNYNTPNTQLYNFTGKLLILMFWSPLCSSAARQVALLDSLQKQFKNSLVILPVSSVQTGDSAGGISRFITGYKQRIKNGFTLPSVVEDTLLAQLFPFTTVPDYIWVKNRQYIARTETNALTAENIEAVINNMPVNLPQKVKRQNYDATTLLRNYAAGLEQVQPNLYKGKITALAPALGFLTDSVGGNRIVAINCGTGNMYALAFNAPVPLFKNRIINTTGNTYFFDDLFSPATATFTVYNYEFIQHANPTALQLQMQRDLSSYFKVQAAVEKQPMKCWVMQAADSSLSVSRHNIAGNSLFEDIHSDRFIYNQRLDMLTERLNTLLDMPVVDETHIIHLVDLQLPNNLADIPALRSLLKKQGIMLTEATRLIDVFVVTKTDNCQSPGIETTQH